MQMVRHAYGRQTVDGMIAFGGDRQRCGDEDYSVDENGITTHREHVGEFLNEAIMSAPLAGSWAGIMPFSVDGQPLVGELDPLGLPGLWLASGFGPHGIMEGPFAGKLLADAVTGVAPLPEAVAAKFNPCREGGATLKGA